MAFVIDRFDRQGCSPLELSLPPVRPGPREHWRAGVDTRGGSPAPGNPLPRRIGLSRVVAARIGRSRMGPLRG
jgi:hypothetical protein